MRQEDRDKRTAVLISAAIHAVVFMLLAAGGVFTFIQTRSQPEPIDVTVYNEEASSDLPAAGNDGGGPTYRAPAGAMPQIDESYTDSVQEKREVRHIMAEQGVDAQQAKNIADERREKKSSLAGAVGISSAAGTAEEGGNGQGNGAGSGSSSSGNGSGHGVAGEDGGQPETKARLVSVPNVDSYYPEGLRRKNIGGTVIVHIVIAADGSVTSASVSSSSGYEDMDRAAVQIAYGCVYEPARNRYGQAVASERDLHIPFQIR